MTAADSSDRSPFPEPLLRFVELFNRERFWESHEALEETWRALDSDFYQGLILYASAFVHAKRGNPHGIVAQLDKARDRLEAYAPHYLGVDVEEILAHGARCRDLVQRHLDDAPSLSERIPLPRLELDPARIQGDELELPRR